MKPLSVQRVIEFCAGQLESGDAAASVSGVCTDSRRASSEDVFVALVGDRFDAHDFIPEVAGRVGAVIVDRVDPAWGELPCSVIRVDDTLAGLQQLANGYRRWLNPSLVGLTGSNGKTSTKDLTAAVLGSGFQTRATLGNLNNHIGVPLTLLAMEAEDQFGVVEMGMNHAGEIKTLVDIAEPDAAILTNVGMAHIENLGTHEAIAWEKATLPCNVARGGVVVLNATDSYTPLIARHCQAEVFTAGTGTGDVRASNLRPTDGGTSFTLDFAGQQVQTHLPVVGEHMVTNAALAACMGWRQGLSPEQVAEALRAAQLTGGRMEVREVRGIRFINDSYNANPDSMKAGLDTLAGMSSGGRKVAVLGEMGELGNHAESGHRDVGRWAAELGLDGIFSVGEGAIVGKITDAAKEFAESPAEVLHFAEHGSCTSFLSGWLKEGDSVLLKGSRSARMETILALFEEAS
jgi:UDP-N-acetylmuramoyl-tripeptide--D-alanyl-D-alanine ligase